MLEEYLESQANTSYINSAIKATGPLAIGAGIAGGIWLGVKAWAGVQAALLGPIEDAKEEIAGLFAPRTDDENRTTPNKVKDWVVLDLSDLLQLAPEGSAARKAGDFGERAGDAVIDGILSIFGI
jgi:hypothetical protein